MSKKNPVPTIVIFVTKKGVHEIQVHSPEGSAEGEAEALYQELKPTIQLLSRIAQGLND